MEKKVKNLKEKVYLLLYGKPNYKADISKIIYGKESKTINRIFKELQNENPPWIKPVKTSVNRKDGRSWNQKNYIALPQPLFEYITQFLRPNKGEILEFFIDNREKIMKLFDSKPFRKFIHEAIRYYIVDNINDVFFMIKEEIGEYCMFLDYIYGDHHPKPVYNPIKTGNELLAPTNSHISHLALAFAEFAEISSKSDCFELVNTLGNVLPDPGGCHMTLYLDIAYRQFKPTNNLH